VPNDCRHSALFFVSWSLVLLKVVAGCPKKKQTADWWNSRRFYFA
jgi:hypothetical protein